jgi:hypothetical protein
VPICLLCTLDDIELWKVKGSEGYYPRARLALRPLCLNSAD